jgi:hypothetical protein
MLILKLQCHTQYPVIIILKTAYLSEYSFLYWLSCDLVLYTYQLSTFYIRYSLTNAGCGLAHRLEAVKDGNVPQVNCAGNVLETTATCSPVACTGTTVSNRPVATAANDM